MLDTNRELITLIGTLDIDVREKTITITQMSNYNVHAWVALVG